jgi:YfiH family protein
MPGFSYNASGGIGYYTIDALEATGEVKTCFSTRTGGISTGSYYSLNLGFKSGDDIACVKRNFELLCDAAGFSREDLVLSDQVHGDRYRIVGRKDRGKGTVIDSDIVGVDALITNERGVALCIFTADCVPVFLYDRENKAAALCHAGWRGVAGDIVLKTVDAMKASYNSSPKDMTAAIGPSIGPCCFNVGTDVAGVFEKMFPDTDNIVMGAAGGCRVNLWNAVNQQLKSAGVKESDIICSGLCTSCCSEFYSYRRDRGKTGRMISILQLI